MQMTLGSLIDYLETLPSDTEVANLCAEHSYRGYYCDLAFTLDVGSTRSAASLLAACKGSVGRMFEGYKGGYYKREIIFVKWLPDSIRHALEEQSDKGQAITADQAQAFEAGFRQGWTRAVGLLQLHGLLKL